MVPEKLVMFPLASCAAALSDRDEPGASGESRVIAIMLPRLSCMQGNGARDRVTGSSKLIWIWVGLTAAIDSRRGGMRSRPCRTLTAWPISARHPEQEQMARAANSMKAAEIPAVMFDLI